MLSAVGAAQGVPTTPVSGTFALAKACITRDSERYSVKLTAMYVRRRCNADLMACVLRTPQHRAPLRHSAELTRQGCLP